MAFDSGTPPLPVRGLTNLAVSHVEKADGVFVRRITSTLEGGENIVGKILGKLTERGVEPPNCEKRSERGKGG